MNEQQLLDMNERIERITNDVETLVADLNAQLSANDVDVTVFIGVSNFGKHIRLCRKKGERPPEVKAHRRKFIRALLDDAFRKMLKGMLYPDAHNFRHCWRPYLYLQEQLKNRIEEKKLC